MAHITTTKNRDLGHLPGERRQPRRERKRRRMVKLWGAMMNRRNSAAVQRFADRRQREEDAPRLCDEIPDLVSLRLEIEERSGVTVVKHVRHVVVDRAPSLFVMPCGDPRCTGGGHDLTEAMMRALRAHQTSARGDDACYGSTGPSPCGRVMHFEAVARYRA
jgi:hypothetical protein